MATINASYNTKESIKKKLYDLSFFGLAFKQKIQSTDINNLVPYGGKITLKKNGFLKWEIFTEEPINYIVRLNGYPMSINEKGDILEEQLRNEKGEALNDLIVFNVNVNSKNDTRAIFNEEIKPFLNYVTSLKSKLGPAISEIDFDDLKGLSFVSYDKKRIILGRRKDFNLIEEEIFKTKDLLMEKKEYTNYSEFDFRFLNRIICRK
jgi:hypothetical protein